MAEVRSFRGLRYNLSKIGDLSTVTAPPYDVISPEAQQAYYGKSDYNAIRLELGLDRKGDTAGDNKYTRAAALFERWQNESILVPEPQPSMYVYEQVFDLDGQRKVRRGLIACLKLEEWESGVVLPHEETLAKPLADRLHLMRACHANFSPVFGLFEEDSGAVARLLKLRSGEGPAVEMRDGDGEAHRLWIISDAEQLRELRRSISRTRVYIADGHHRYQTALRYRDQMREKHPGFSGDEAFNFVMMLLVDMDDPGLVVLPTHREVRAPGLDPVALERELQKYFHIEHRPVVSDDSLALLVAELSNFSSNGTVFGACGLRPGAFSVLILNGSTELEDILPRERSKPWRELDVSILHSLVMERILGIGAAGAVDGNIISFTRDETEAFLSVRKGHSSLSFFVVPPTVAQVRAVALAGDKMPQKSTYFHPKPLTGLVINRLDGVLSDTPIF